VNLQQYVAELHKSDAEETLAAQMKMIGLTPERQFKWAEYEKTVLRPYPKTATLKPRGWAADFAFVNEKLLIEVDGQIWQKGGHTSGKGYTEDRERDAESLCCGYRTLRVTTGQVESGEALAWIARLTGK
jgi:very-short-patch-repair endonuclease